ncbi:tyrosine-type recombinase/integrase [Amycolatopsis sp., V23-08]|uniref:Tyrosine-type recombinase/integrase n=1 Tax=Amycolatopsis heterodermiae TaxID=3110235 RepID=A0ABU5RKE5_9PSEU|nr:tyrosine-type recombinase/integrase [Amycolatopsis sp., V23-08]MEA5366039.1 tyrosine-type recombinase/integrase [Amycolatopsis sp., V23-08]
MAELLSELSASFQRHLRAEGRAKRTCALHEQAIRFFSDWLNGQGLSAISENCTKDNIRNWLADLADQVGPGTVRIRWAGMRRFTRWLVAEGVLDDYPMTGLGEPEVPEKPVPVLSDDELAALIKACSGKDFAARRDEAIIRMLLDCGLRVSELCGITVEGLDLDNGSVMVTGKRGKVRQAFFGARTERALDRYVRMRRQHRWSHAEALFLGQRGALSTDGVRTRMEVRAAQAGLADPSNPHRFRHTWANDFLLAGGQERDLKRLAGWSSDVMLEVYGRSAADARAEKAARQMKRGDRV